MNAVVNGFTITNKATKLISKYSIGPSNMSFLFGFNFLNVLIRKTYNVY